MQTEKKTAKPVRISNTLLVNKPIHELWEFFADIERFAGFVPTVKEYKMEDEVTFSGKVGVTLGKIPVRSKIIFKITKKEGPFYMEAEGISYMGETIVEMKKSKSEAGEINKKSVGRISTTLRLSVESDNSTRLDFVANVVAEGKLRNIYNSIVKLKVPAIKKEFVENLRRAFSVAVEQIEDQVEAVIGVETPAGEKKPGRIRRFFSRKKQVQNESAV